MQLEFYIILTLSWISTTQTFKFILIIKGVIDIMESFACSPCFLITSFKNISYLLYDAKTQSLSFKPANKWSGLVFANLYTSSLRIEIRAYWNLLNQTFHRDWL